ncbi:MAG: ABC transporter ATP-binding protein [Desulfovibrionaceae bacterium]|nr:ABC transporter ATP-binding protein [Desulfovibrionaceae bacterium]
MILKAEKLCFRYPDGPEFRNLSLELNSGGPHILIGPNGAGKSALLRALVGALPLTGGRLSLNGEDLAALSSRERAKRLAYIPQELPASPLTVYETVLLGRTPHLRFTPDRRDRLATEASLERLGIVTWRDRQQKELSGGERRQVFLALALAQAATVLLLDEPAGSLDQRRGMEIYELLRSLGREEGKLILAAEHDLNLAARYGEQILALHQGRVVALGRPETAITQELLSKLYGLKSLVQKIKVHGPDGQWEERPQAIHLGLDCEDIS